MGLLPNTIFVNNPLFRQNFQKNLSAYLLDKHQNLFCKFFLKYQIFNQKAHSATVPL